MAIPLKIYPFPLTIISVSLKIYINLSDKEFNECHVNSIQAIIFTNRIITPYHCDEILFSSKLPPKARLNIAPA